MACLEQTDIYYIYPLLTDEATYLHKCIFPAPLQSLGQTLP